MLKPYFYETARCLLFYFNNSELKVIFLQANLHCVKYCNFTLFPGVKIFWKGTVSA